MKLKLFVNLLILFFLWTASGEPISARACAGYTINIGSYGSPQQELLTQVLAELIRQRTGTTIQFLRYASQDGLMRAVDRQEVDLLVAEVDKLPAGTTALQALQPFGAKASSIVPVFRTETLEKFPALKRLVNRLSGQIDDVTLQKLVAELEAGDDIRGVAKKFLIGQKLIFGG